MGQVEIPQQSFMVKDFRLIQMIYNNIFTYFAKPLGFISSQMHCTKVGGVSCFVQQTHTNIV